MFDVLSELSQGAAQAPEPRDYMRVQLTAPGSLCGQADACDTCVLLPEFQDV